MIYYAIPSLLPNFSGLCAISLEIFSTEWIKTAAHMRTIKIEHIYEQYLSNT